MNAALDVVVPGTGELVNLRALDREQLVDVRAHLSDLATHLAAVKIAVNTEITRRIDEENATAGTGYTWRVGDWKITVPSPAALGKLRDEAMRAELITTHRDDLDIDALFRRNITFTLRLDRWTSLIKQRPELDEIRRRHTAPAARNVTITPLPALIRPVTGRVIDATAEDDDE